jgi:hypothetical protein
MATLTTRKQIKTPQQEVRQLRATAKRIIASRKESLRILVATGMYTASGDLKPQFR